MFKEGREMVGRGGGGARERKREEDFRSPDGSGNIKGLFTLGYTHPFESPQSVMIKCH